MKEPMNRITAILASLAIITVLAICAFAFGGFLIGAVNPYFGFDLFDGDDYWRADRSIDVSAYNMGVDHLCVACTRAGEVYTFERGSTGVADITVLGPFYLGLIRQPNGKPARIVSVSALDSSCTGVWSIDSGRAPNAWMGPSASLHRLSESDHDRRTMAFARVLFDGPVIVFYLALMLCLESFALILWVRLKRRNRQSGAVRKIDGLSVAGGRRI